MSSSPERAAQVGHELPGVATVAALPDLVDLGVEAVAISTPVATHSALADAALRLGLAVVCDKPFALNAAAARRTVALAAERGLPLSPYQNRRWDSDFRTVQRLLGTGALGRVTRLESRFERFAPDAGPGPSGGGTLLDFCSHLVDQALVLLGPVRTVYAERRPRESGLDDDVFLALTHRNGARSHLWGSWSQAAPGPRWRVTGTDATYVQHAGDSQEDQLVAGRTPRSEGEQWGREPHTVTGTLHVGTEQRLVPVERGRWDLFYPAFAAAVRGRAPAPVTAQDAVSTARVLDAARGSADTGQALSLVDELE